MKGDMVWALLFVKYGVPILAFIALIGALYLYFLGSHAAKTFDPVLQMFLDVLDRIMLPKTKHWSEVDPRRKHRPIGYGGIYRAKISDRLLFVHGQDEWLIKAKVTVTGKPTWSWFGVTIPVRIDEYVELGRLAYQSDTAKANPDELFLWETLYLNPPR